MPKKANVRDTGLRYRCLTSHLEKRKGNAMEILKFDESGSSSRPRKPSGRGTILVAFVAVVFGAGTALASGTLQINSNNTVALDQGVANSVQCDTSIDVSLKTNYNTNTKDFVYKGVDISNISGDCNGKYFTIHTYDEEGYEMAFCTSGTDVGCAIDGKSSKLPVASTNLSYAFTRNLATGTITNNVTRVNVKTVTVESSDT